MSGVLYVVATPIGNLEDWSSRASRTLAEVDLLLAEDTRHTRHLLSRNGIQVPLESYHDFNEAGRAAKVLDKLRSGSRVALVSDQGTPGVSDPGYRLVRLCRENKIAVIPIPGPNAAIAALSVSGLPTDSFHFIGFLPSRKEARKRRLEAIRNVEATLILFEAPHRVRGCLEDLIAVFGNRTMFAAREMTKLHEEYLYGPAAEILAQITTRGEIVMVVAGAAKPDVGGLPAPDLMNTSRADLLKLIARRLGVSRRALYDALYRK